jgi:signal transduction histidine kinase
MKDYLFKNIFTLKLKSQEIRKAFNENCKQNQRLNIFFSVIILLIQIGLLIINIQKFADLQVSEEKKPGNFQNEINRLSKNFLLIYFSLSFGILNLFLNIIVLTGCFIGIKINISTYFSLNLVLLNFRSLLFIVFQVDPNIFLFFESGMNTAYLIIISNEFLPVLASNIIIIFIFWITSYLNTGFTMIQNLAYTGIMLIFCAHCYINDMNNKKLFYYQKTRERESKYINNTLENMLNGFGVLKNETLEYANKYMKNNLSFLMEKKQTFMDLNQMKDSAPVSNMKKKESLNTIMCVDRGSKNESSLQHQSSNMILHKTNFNFVKIKEESASDSELFYCFNKNLLHRLENINIELDGELQGILSQDGLNLNSTLSLISKNKALFDEFTYLGCKNYSFYDETIQGEKNYFLDIYLRIVIDDNGENKYEFLFNNVTDKKENFMAKEEMKKKSMSLAKISHEFKNPVIIISELGEEIGEELNKSNCSLQIVHESLNLMKNLAAYILILVKDFEVISKKEASSGIELVCSWFDLRKEISNLNGIVLTLISKKYGGGEAPIDFVIKIDEDVATEIYTDKLRLLQILINLVSNSIKFTQNGTITLSVQYKDNRIRFSVEDTGCGLSDEQAKNIFKEYVVKSNEASNSCGSGLGLSIVKELCEKMGSNIVFSPNQPNGSIFSFAIEQVNFKKKENKSDDKSEENKKPKFKNMINRIRKSMTLLDEKFSFQFKNSKTVKFSKVKTLDIYVPQYCSGNVEDVKRLHLTKTGSNRSNQNYPLMETGLTVPIDPLNAMKNPPYVDINGTFCIPERSFSSSSINNLPSPMFIPLNISILKEMQISSFDFLFEGYESPLYKGRMNKKTIRSKANHVNLQNNINFIIVDDEKMIRKSIFRIIEKTCEKLQIEKEVNIYEVPDGIECLFMLYNSVINNQKIDLVLSDESMNFMSGSTLIDLASQIFGSKIPMAILTSYEGAVIKTQRRQSSIDAMHLQTNLNLQLQVQGLVSPSSSRRNNSTINVKDSDPAALVGIYAKPLSTQDFEKILKQVNLVK